VSTIQAPNRLKDLTAKIVESYRKNDSVINYLGRVPLPSRELIVESVLLTREILFPGYFAERGIRTENLDIQVGSMVDRLLSILTPQIELAIHHQLSLDDSDHCNQIDASEVAEAFVSAIPEIRNLLISDVRAAKDGDPACRSYDEVIFCYPGLEAITVYRIANFFYRKSVPLIPRIMSEWVHQQTGIDIHPGAQIGSHFFIDHGTGLVIGETCKIGDYVRVYQGVTLGAISFPKDDKGNVIRGAKRHPTIEDNVVIYANATVLGGKTTVGHHSVIGSSVWITSSIEPFTTVLMEKPKLKIRSEMPDELMSAFDFQI
jgi:serine O-acetyltransferase